MEETSIRIWTPHANQLPIAKSKKKYRFLRCGRRFGKTRLLVGSLIEDGLESEDGEHFYVGPTYKQAKMIAWKMLVRMVKDTVPPELIHKINENELFVEIGNHSRVHIKGQDNPDSLRGVALRSAALDEYKDFREGVFEEIIEPALLDYDGRCIVAGTPKGFNHMYRLEKEALKHPDLWDVFHYSTYDNPFMSRPRIERIKRSRSVEVFEQEYMAEYRKSEGLVYKDFDHARHVYVGPPPDKQWVEVCAGVDFGFSNPMASNILKRDRDNHWWVMPKHFYAREKNTADLIEWAKGAVAEEKVEKWYPDPAEPDRVKEMRDAGLHCVDVNKHKSVAAGIDRLRHLLRTGRFHVSAECKDLIYEFETYSYPKAHEGYNEKEDPIKKNDHALDEVRMVVYTCDPIDLEPEEGESEFNLYGSNYK